MTKQPEGQVVASWNPDGNRFGEVQVPIVLDSLGHFRANLLLHTGEDPIELHADTLAGLKAKLSKAWVADRPDICVPGVLVDTATGKVLNVSFVGIHGGTGNARFRGGNGKAVAIDRYSTTDPEEWSTYHTVFVPSEGLELKELDHLVLNIKEAHRRELEARKARDPIEGLSKKLGLDVAKMGGYGRSKKSELGEQEREAVERIKRKVAERVKCQPVERIKRKVAERDE